jgi:hypothetical protein
MGKDFSDRWLCNDFPAIRVPTAGEASKAFHWNLSEEVGTALLATLMAIIKSRGPCNRALDDH